jgi:hypothetical protein
MLGAEPVVLQLHRLLPGQAEHDSERPGRRQAEGGQHVGLPGPAVALAGAGGPLHPSPGGLDLDPALAEGGRGQALPVAEESQQEVLGADLAVAEPVGLNLGVVDGSLGTLGDPHPRHLPSLVWPPA